MVMKTITANEIKTKGIVSIDAVLQEQEEAVISVRGIDRYVVMDMKTYNRLRVCELEAALYQVRREIAEGKGVEESVDEHIARIQKLEP
jgi:PHD/YefM family antitoxin component YafN of YafNO toxin-antitoxin module